MVTSIHTERLSRPLAAALILSVLCLALQGLGQPVIELLRFERESLAEGQWWRLLTAHLVHLGWRHALLNVLALCLVAWIFQRTCSILCLGSLALASALAIDLGLWFLDPEIHWYVGLSGVLHGLLAGAIARDWAGGRNASGWIGAALVGKLAWEQLYGALPMTAQAAGGPVVVQAHLYGALGGLAVALAVIAIQGKPATI
jgi:rhomboid family GlyGly-CTERM serine protease